MSTRVGDQPAYIIRRREWRNTSLILDLFTRDYGCISVVARGARRNPGKVQYQPFVPLAVGWSGHGDLKTLTGIENQNLAVDEKNYLALLYVNELIALFLPQGESSPEIFAYYRGMLERANREIDEAELRRFELHLMYELGYFPDISRDARSGADIDAERYYQFIINSGFVECGESAHDSISGRVVRDWLRDDYGTDSVRRLAKSVLRSTIDFNLHGKVIKSRDFYHDMQRRR
jgi:DNA repair protein RecO (recombination protein O)